MWKSKKIGKYEVKFRFAAKEDEGYVKYGKLMYELYCDGVQVFGGVECDITRKMTDEQVYVFVVKKFEAREE